MLVRSRFDVEARSDESGRTVLYNTLSGALTVFEREELSSLDRALREPDRAEPELLDVLVQQGHLVEQAVDEMAVVLERRRAGITDRNRLDLVVMPTLDCNFRCSYCYEDHRRSTMTDDTAAALVAFLRREVPRTKLVLLHWFGGEPLLQTDRVVEVTGALRLVAAEEDVHASVHVTTNGYLLSGTRLRALLNVGIRDFQVTIDGPEATHDALRPLAGGGPTYARVHENVSSAVMADPDVRITLRVNYSHRNIDRLTDLVGSFDASVRAQLRLVLEPIFGGSSVAATANLAPDVIAATVSQVYGLAAELGYDVSAGRANLTPGKLVYCYAERSQQAIVAPDGSVFKCAVSTFETDERLGRLTPDGLIESVDGRLERWAAVGESLQPICEQCAYLPLCMGGCRKAQVTQGRSGDFCSLVPANASHVLKTLSLAGLSDSLLTVSNPEGRPYP